MCARDPMLIKALTRVKLRNIQIQHFQYQEEAYENLECEELSESESIDEDSKSI
jgi:hypothetical protein